ncbi:MAG: RNA methyltransferase [Chloroflexi bacterium]|nr:RNA methyltransferase [Chloroflexota bacterium]
MRAKIEALVVAPDLLSSSFGRELIHDAATKDLPIFEVSGEIFKSISVKEGPQGIGAVACQRWMEIEMLQLAPGDQWIALDAVQDPGNLGTILRTSDAVGGKGVVLLEHSTDPYDPTALRASMGAIFAQGLVRANLEQFADWKTRSHYSVIGTSGGVKCDFHHAEYPDPLVLLMGSERQGLSARHLELCDQVVAIPMVGRSDSLNLAVATGVMLYEIFNHRRDIRKG